MVTPLNDDEIKTFVDDLDHNNDGQIDYSEVEAKLDAAYDELQPDENDIEARHDRHAFLRSIIGSDAQRIPRDQFVQRVKEWQVPSLEQEKDEERLQDEYIKKMGIGRRLRSYWAVHGPSILFLCIVVGMMLAFGIWQLVKYLGPAYSGALGWGVVVAKTCAGVLYPTLFFLLLSMSRIFSTAMRSSYHLSRFINWDLSQAFHIYMAIFATFLGTLHGIAHLTGDFIWIANAYRPQQLESLLGPKPWTYRDLIRSRPGITGIIALFCFYFIGLTSTPWLRRKNYEIFQLGHLLMYVIIGCLMAHGTAALLQWPMLGYFLAFPTLLVLIERVHRLAAGFHSIQAQIRTLDSETVEIKATILPARIFKHRYCAGQYVFLQVPELSFFQWHPFTVSACSGNSIQLNIKTDGNWTKRLRSLAEQGEIRIGIDGPYGAPAQRFYDFSHTILVGSGIGFTPFSGILADLQAREDKRHGGPDDAVEKVASSRRSSDKSRSRSSLFLTRTFSNKSSKSDRARNPTPPEFPDDYRRVDLHWVVRSRNHLGWFTDLLNSVCRSQDWHEEHDGLAHPHLDIRMHTHVTQKRDLVPHVYRYLLEKHRTKENPKSPLTGLTNETLFGRPDFEAILDQHYEDMRRYRAELGEDCDDRVKVGVFFCGAPKVGEILADRCRLLTARGREDGSRIEYYFMMEVFG